MTVCIPYSDFGGGEVKGDTFNAISCLRFKDTGNSDDALLKGTLLSHGRLGKEKLSKLSLSGPKLELSDRGFS